MLDTLDCDRYYCRINSTYITICECVILYMFGVVYSNVECARASYDEMCVWSIVPKFSICGLFMTSLNCKYVVIISRKFSLVTMLFLLCDHEDEYVYTHSMRNYAYDMFMVSIERIILICIFISYHALKVCG